MANGNGFGALVGIEITEQDGGLAQAVMEAGNDHLNAHGTVHGGAIATLCDSAMGMAVRAAGTNAPVTVDMRVTYLRPGQPGRVVADAQVRKRGKKIIVVEAEVTQDGETVALASATFTDVG